jgi:hypothetical protein
MFLPLGRTTRVSLWALVLAVSLVSESAADQLTLHFEVIGPDGPSSFKPQIHVQITDESFTSFPLIEELKASELLVDGHPFKRTDAPFEGPDGLPAKGSWEGCLKWNEYLPQGLSPGAHHLQWRLGGAISNEIRMKAYKPLAPADTPRERLRQVQSLKETIAAGLPQSCVQNWLKDRDGGLAGPDEIRYYVDPGVKVLVPYDQTSPDPKVKGPIRVYLESRVAD